MAFVLSYSYFLLGSIQYKHWWPKTQGAAILTFHRTSCAISPAVNKNAASPGQSGQWCSSAVVSLPKSYPRKSLNCCLHLMTIYCYYSQFLSLKSQLQWDMGTFWVFLSNSLRFKHLQDYLCLIMFDQPSNEFNHKYCNPLICYIRSYQIPFGRSGQGRSSLRSGGWMWGFKLCPLALVPSQWPDKAFFIVTWLHGVPLSHHLFRSASHLEACEVLAWSKPIHIIASYMFKRKNTIPNNSKQNQINPIGWIQISRSHVHSLPTYACIKIVILQVQNLNYKQRGNRTERSHRTFQKFGEKSQIHIQKYI